MRRSNDFDGAETNCGIAHILGILLMNSYHTDIFFSNFYHLQSVHFELQEETGPVHLVAWFVSYGKKIRRGSKRPRIIIHVLKESINTCLVMKSVLDNCFDKSLHDLLICRLQQRKICLIISHLEQVGQISHSCSVTTNGFLKKLWGCVRGRGKQKLGFIKRVDKGWITTVKNLESKFLNLSRW